MKFYNREKELSKLAELADLSEQASHMAVVTGRRRVGKTELIKQFSRKRADVFYFFVSKKKPNILLEEFRDMVAERIPLIKATNFRSFGDFFSFLFDYMKEHPIVVVFDEFQNFESVDPAVFSIIQNLWDRDKDRIRGMIIFIGSVHTLMKRIFEGSKEPLFGRATAKMYLEPLGPDTIAHILSDYKLDPARHLLFFYALFGGIPKYYFLLDRYRLLEKGDTEIIQRLFTEEDAPLQHEGMDLLIEEFGKNYHLYFSILQVIAGGETQMARIADGTGINVNSISKYLDELTNYYQVLERRIPVTEEAREKKIGRYYIKDHALRFWFRYIFRNQSLIEIGDESTLTQKITDDLPTYSGKCFEELIRELLLKRNTASTLPFRFTKIGSFWTRKENIEIDIVTVNEDGGQILFGECKLQHSKFTKADIKSLKEKAQAVKWNKNHRKEYFALFSCDEIPIKKKQILAAENVLAFDLKDLLMATSNT